MPFSTTGSIISTDLDNMLRGYYRDNSDSLLTGTTNETTLKSVNIAANSIGPTGGIHLIAGGSITGTGGTKTFRLKFGSATIGTIVQGASTTTVWSFDTWIFNTSVTQQRTLNRQTANDLLSMIFGYTTLSIDTSQNQTLQITGQLGSGSDSVTLSMFDVFVVQPN